MVEVYADLNFTYHFSKTIFIFHFLLFGYNTRPVLIIFSHAFFTLTSLWDSPLLNLLNNAMNSYIPTLRYFSA